MAYLDELAAKAAWAMRSGRPQDIAAVAHTFYSRFSGFDGERIVPCASRCTGFTISGDEFSLSFSDRNIQWCREGDRWVVSESDGHSPRFFDRHDAAVDKFSAPFSFLEGMAFLADCIRNVGLSKVLIKQEKAERAISRAIDIWIKYREEYRVMREAVNSPAFKREAIRRCSAGVATAEQPPDPPQETMTVEAARASLRSVSGCYFLWGSGGIEYVGRANCIATRLGDSHHKLKSWHRVSCVRMPASESWIAEPYYIWRYRPPLNGECIKASKPTRKNKQAAK